MRSSSSTARSGPSWRRATEPLALLAALGLASACYPRASSGEVQADFTVDDCPPGDDNDGLEDYGFEPGFFGVTRFYDDVTIELFEYRVLVEETDGLSIRLRLGDLVEAGQIAEDGDSGRYRLTAPPLELPVSLEGNARASLSMFQTCFDFPTVHAVSGTLRFDRLRLAIDPEDLGRDERVAGTLTASIARGAPQEHVGTLTAVFDFEVPRRPLLSVQ